MNSANRVKLILAFLGLYILSDIVWVTLELAFYQEVQTRIVDTIMAALFNWVIAYLLVENDYI